MSTSGGSGPERKKEDREWKKKKKRILNFQPAAWERSVFLPVSQAPWNEKAKQTCSPRLYLVNHLHYKPVLQALWGRREGERETQKEWKVKLVEQAVNKQYLNKVEQDEISNQLLNSKNFFFSSSGRHTHGVRFPIVVHGALWESERLAHAFCLLEVRRDQVTALCAGMWLHREVNNPIGKLAWPLINSCCLCEETMAGKPKTLFNSGPYLYDT